MPSLLRSSRLLAHLFLSGLAFLVFALFRRGGVLVFTHHADVDGSGRDAQMGPLVDALRRDDRPLIEVTLVSLSGGLLHNLLVKRRLFVSHAALLAAARLLAWLPWLDHERGRDLIGRAFLRALRPAVALLIDESGSGQLLVRAARALWIPAVGVQHGDFQVGNPQYGSGADAAPVNLLCLWSPWFRARLLVQSENYGEHNTLVVGRMRYAEPDHARDPSASVLRVLLVSQRRPGFGAEVEPFLEALRTDEYVRLRVKPHPGEEPLDWPAPELVHTSLARAILDADVVIGIDSSALLEALWWRRPAVTLVAGVSADAQRSEAFVPCGAPEELSDLCRRLARDEGATERRSRLVWGDAQGHAVEAILAAIRERRNALRSAA